MDLLMKTEWLEVKSEHIIKHSLQLNKSYEELTGKKLAVAESPEELAEKMYCAKKVLLSHDGTADPCFTYANKTAQELWELPWSDFIGLPSKYSAEPDERDQRQKLLQEVSEKGFIDNYKGIRISKSGKRFYIEGVTVWNIIENGQKCGQAAVFENWQFI